MNARQVLKEPLLHFLMLGLLVFAAYAWLGDGAGARDEIVVTRGQQINLINTFTSTWRRPPTPAELDGLLDDYIRQEIAYRQSLAMELDRDDVVIRRRLRQKLELLTEDLASLAPPNDAELESFYADNAERFRTEPRYSFEQIYFGHDRRGDRADADARELLARLEAGGADADPETLGDPISLPARLRGATAAEISARFGNRFVEQLAQIEPGAWTGPVASGYGLHLVRVDGRVESRVPPLEDVAGDVLNELLTVRRRDAIDTLYDALAERYTIRVEPLEPAAEAGLDAAGAGAGAP